MLATKQPSKQAAAAYLQPQLVVGCGLGQWWSPNLVWSAAAGCLSRVACRPGPPVLLGPHDGLHILLLLVLFIFFRWDTMQLSQHLRQTGGWATGIAQLRGHTIQLKQLLLICMLTT